MRDLVGVGLAIFLGVIGVFYAYGQFGGSNTTSMVQETFLEVQQARGELASYAAASGGSYGTSVYTAAQLAAIQALPSQAINGTNLTNQWKGSIVVTGNTNTLFVDYTNVDPSGCTKLLVKAPQNTGITGIAVASSLAAVASATINALPVSLATAAGLCTATSAVRFVVS